MNAPTPIPRHRWLSYSLRTLFILVTVLCVWLGMYASRAERQKRAVEWIEKHGGEVRYDYEYTREPPDPNPEHTEADGYRLREIDYDENGAEISPGPHWLHDLLGKDYFATVVDAELQDVENENDLPPIKDLPGLRYLTIRRMPDAGWVDVHRLTHLQRLDYRSDRTTAAILKRISRLVTLRELSVSDLQSAISDADLRYFEGLTKLEFLDIDSNQTTDAGLEHLKGLIQLRHLGLGGTISDEGMACMRGMIKLESLRLGGEKLTDFGIANLTGLTHLRFLNLDARISDAGLELLKGMTPLEFVSLSSHRMSDPGIQSLEAARPKLRVLTRDQMGSNF